ncbi:surfactin synthase thioesterase subunit [Kineothrix alysoides]|uniref:Surfactin synthase thioesterase subunit n=1 Tax=Kineothrix alysoides TaxID=1469948 RepID=A0A4R1QUF6_9FIRM|nr:thioesterase domain-containing protein [Kineothrix alysoides]TCL57599.1 surfactin synthase thioesterase subunit [Kineothrix alysoides]
MEEIFKEKVKLFCFPYAGASSYIYSKWRRLLDSRIDLQIIELAGRGTRINERPYQDIYEAADDLYNKLKDKINENPVILLGYSMGSLLAFEIAGKLQQYQKNELVHTFFLAKNPPHCGSETVLSNLREDRLKELVMSYGGTPKEILDNKETSEYFLTILRNDFKLVETYNLIPKREKLKCDMTVMYGSDDTTLKSSEINQWAAYTSGVYSEIIFPGNHFFIQEEGPEVINNINKVVDNYFYDKRRRKRRNI